MKLVSSLVQQNSPHSTNFSASPVNLFVIILAIVFWFLAGIISLASIHALMNDLTGM